MVAMAVLIRTFSSGIHAHPVSWNCAYHLRMELSRWWLFPEFDAELPLDNCTPTIVLNNPVFCSFISHYQLVYFFENSWYLKVSNFRKSSTLPHNCYWLFIQLHVQAHTHKRVRLLVLPCTLDGFIGKHFISYPQIIIQQLTNIFNIIELYVLREIATF